MEESGRDKERRTEDRTRKKTEGRMKRKKRIEGTSGIYQTVKWKEEEEGREGGKSEEWLVHDTGGQGEPGEGGGGARGEAPGGRGQGTGKPRPSPASHAYT